MSKKGSGFGKQNPNKNLIFKVLTILFPIILLIFFELLLRLFGYGDNLHLFVKNPAPGYEKYMIVNPIIGKKYFQKFEYTSPPNDIFLKDKPKNTFRIFVMGSSTVYGFPYERNMMFSRILSKQLQDNFPQYNIEVVNTAITAINSFTLLDFSDQIIKYQPDAVLIYAGQNEFYGAFGAGSNETMNRNFRLTRMHIKLMNFKTYQLLRNSIGALTSKMASKKNVRHGTLMKRIVGKEDILYNSDTYKIGINSYRRNMDDLLAKFNKNHIPVFYSELVSNVKDQKPFNSKKTDQLEAASDVYQLAQQALAAGDDVKAHELFYKAKDLDCIRFRASEDINTIVRDLANKYQAHLIPMLRYFEDNSPHRLIGDNLMTEHLHPNIAGNFLMAQAFYNEMLKSDVMKAKPESELDWQYIRRNWGYTALDSLIAVQRVNNLKSNWPFVLDMNKESTYKLDYQPKSAEDSAAFSVIKYSDVKFDNVRLKMAKKYEDEKRFDKAFEEYNAFLWSNPYVAINYRDAARLLLQLGDLPLALKYFEKSLDYEDSFFADFKIGEIYLIMGDYANAAKYFEKSYPQAPADKRANVLVKAYFAFVYLNNNERARAIAVELQKSNILPNLKIPPKSYMFNDYIPYKTKIQVEKAKELLKNNKPDEALSILEASLKIYDSHIANRMIGEIHFDKQNFEKAAIYFEKVLPLFKFDPVFLTKMIMVDLARKDYINARNCIQDLKQIDPQNSEIEKLSAQLP